MLPPRLLPLDAIDTDLIPRDRIALDPEPFEELKVSLLTSGLRTPIEVFEIPRAPAPEAPAPDAPAPDAPAPEPLPPERPEPRFGLIAGYRRFAAFKALHAAELPGFAEIPAVVREVTRPDAFRAMVEENEIRAPLSPWERGRAAILAVDYGYATTVEAAVDALHPGATKQKRHKLRTIARVVGEMGGLWTAPQRLSEKNLLDLADALREGFGPPMDEALFAARGRPHNRQWEAIAPYIAEYRTERDNPPNPPHTPGRPKRLCELRRTLSVRREQTREGYVLRFSGPEATSALLDEVIDEIERLYGVGRYAPR